MHHPLLQLTCRPHLARSLPLFQGLRQLVAISIRIQRTQRATSNPHNRSTKREQPDALVRVQQSKDGIRIVPILLKANLLQDVSIHHKQRNSGKKRTIHHQYANTNPVLVPSVNSGA
jgi:hypothetical protein